MNLSPSQLLLEIACVKRAMPRNTAVMAICDALEELLTTPAKPAIETDHAGGSVPVEALAFSPPSGQSSRAKRNSLTDADKKAKKAAYMREYMAKKRVKEST